MACVDYGTSPDQTKLAFSKVVAIIEELDNGKLPKWFNSENLPKKYSVINKTTLDAKTDELCKRLTKMKATVSTLSLEVQIWWRDHQEADRKRLAEEKRERQEKALMNEALSKLTIDEQKVLTKRFDEWKKK